MNTNNPIIIPQDVKLTGSIPANNTIMLYNKQNKVDQFLTFDSLGLPSCPNKLSLRNNHLSEADKQLDYVESILVNYIYGGVMDGQAIYNEERQ